MLPDKAVQDRILLWVAILAATLIQISIAASQVTLGLGILLLLVFRQKLQFPRLWIPLAALFFWTALADVVSPDPWLGRAQIKKFFVFFLLPLIYSTFLTQFSKVFYLMAAWCAAATASALLAIFQFVRHLHESYISYVGKRITGFESHWMTFGGLQLMVLLLLLAHWFFSSRRLARLGVCRHSDYWRRDFPRRHAQHLARCHSGDSVSCLALETQNDSRDSGDRNHKFSGGAA